MEHPWLNSMFIEMEVQRTIVEALGKPHASSKQQQEARAAATAAGVPLPARAVPSFTVLPAANFAARPVWQQKAVDVMEKGELFPKADFQALPEEVEVELDVVEYVVG